jgi:type IV pilus assembly protein PilM
MPSSDILPAVKWELKQTSVSSEELAVDYYLMNENTKDNEAIEVMAISCPEKDVLEHINMIKAADMIPIAVDVDSLASASVIIENNQIAEDEIVLLLEFGFNSCSINIIMDKKIYFKRDLEINGNSLTQGIAKQCNISYEEAEQFKKEFGLIGTEGPPKDLQDMRLNKAMMVNQTLWLHIEDLIQEISYTFKYFTHQFRTGQINKFSRIIISGGVANLNNFSSYLSSYLGVPVEIINPFKNVDLTPEVYSKLNHQKELLPRLAVAMGLALRGGKEFETS